MAGVPAADSSRVPEGALTKTKCVRIGPSHRAQQGRGEEISARDPLRYRPKTVCYSGHAYPANVLTFSESSSTMVKRTVARLTLMLPAVLLLAAPAFAQFAPRAMNDPATGEQYHIEASAGFWLPKTRDDDLERGARHPGVRHQLQARPRPERPEFKELHLVLRPARKHKLRFGTSRSSTNRKPSSPATSSSRASATASACR